MSLDTVRVFAISKLPRIKKQQRKMREQERETRREYIYRESHRMGKATLNEICRVMGLPGKPDGMDRAEVAQYHRDGRIQDIADYCESDVVNTYRVWLRYELFRGKLTEGEPDASEANLGEYIKARSNTKPHLLAYWDAAAGA
jgi:predicted PolB exonuclease-like 3'-5' exonuclease